MVSKLDMSVGPCCKIEVPTLGSSQAPILVSTTLLAMAKEKRGGARRQAVPKVPADALQACLRNYMLASPDPFNFGAYNTMPSSSLGASGAGMLCALDFLDALLEVAPEGHLSGKLLGTTLVKLQRDNVMSRFPLGSPPWQGISNFSDKSVGHWADVITYRVTILLNHVRRIRNNAVKRSQCMRVLSVGEQERIQRVLDKLPSEADSNAPSSTASAPPQMTDVDDGGVAGGHDLPDGCVAPGSLPRLHDDGCVAQGSHPRLHDDHAKVAQGSLPRLPDDNAVAKSKELMGWWQLERFGGLLSTRQRCSKFPLLIFLVVKNLSGWNSYLFMLWILLPHTWMPWLVMCYSQCFRKL